MKSVHAVAAGVLSNVDQSRDTQCSSTGLSGRPAPLNRQATDKSLLYLYGSVLCFDIFLCVKCLVCC